MFGRVPITPVVKLLEPKPRYYGEKGNFLKMDTLRRLYRVVIENIRKARDKLPRKEDKPHRFKINDLVLVKDPCSAIFEPRYQPNYRVTAIFGNNRIEVQDEKGHKSVRRSSHVKYMEPSEKTIQQLPSKELLQKYGRSSKIMLQQKDIPDLKFPGKNVENPSEDREDSENSRESGEETIEIIETTSHKEMFSDKSAVTLQFSDSREHSQNSLNEVEGTSQKQLVMAQPAERNRSHDIFRESGEHSLKSRVNTAITEVREVQQMVENTEVATCQETSRESREDSQNSLKTKGKNYQFQNSLG